LASELRWILLALSAVLLIGIWWWGVRRSRRSPGDALLRESPLSPTVSDPTLGDEVAGARSADPESRDWGVPPFEPLSIRTADFDQVQLVDLQMSATPKPLDVVLSMDSATPPASSTASMASPPVAPPNASASQRIVTVRVCAMNEAPWHGGDLLAALESHGLRFGRYKVFHRTHGDGRTLFCAASLVEPGSFDIATMPAMQFRGVTLFAVLPGPADPLETVDTLIATAVDLADTLHGAVQDASGAPLSAQRAEALREDIARFQESSSLS